MNVWKWSIWQVCLLMSAVLLLVRSEEESILTPAQAHQHIQSYLSHTYKNGGSLCGAPGTSCCNMTATEACSISDFAKDTSTLVFPGGETRCIFSTSTPFAFQVIPGDTDKLLFYFQGGGACWDKGSTVGAAMCTTDISPQSLVGIFDRTNSNNRFKSYTIVHVLYCSGDLHGGNVVRPYDDDAGVPVKQVGLANTQSALDWVNAQIKAGSLAKTFSELVVMGCSAGSLGTQMWAKQVLKTLPWTHAAVIPDSYAGVFPPGSVGPLVYDYGFCTCGFLSADNYAKCMNQTLALEDVNLEFISEIPTVPVSFIQSKTDIVQQSFYVAVAVSVNSPSKSITPSQFYKDVNDIFGLYNKNLPNFMTYLVNGDQHCFTNQRLYYTADPISSSDNGEKTSSILMTDYVNQVPLAKGETLNTVCDGTVQTLRGVNDNTYCSSTVVPKSFVQS